MAVVCSITVVGIAVGMAFWLWRERRRTRGKGRRDPESRPPGAYSGPGRDMKISVFARDGDKTAFRHSLLDKKPLPNTPTIASWGMADMAEDDPAGLNVKNPPYTQAVLDLASPMSPDLDATPTSSSSANRARPPSIPIPMYTPKSFVNPMEETPREDTSLTTASERSRATMSLSSDEIENILDMATIYSTPATPGTLQSSILQGVLPSPMPSFMFSPDPVRADSAVRGESLPSPQASPLPALSIHTASTSGLLTPMTASTHREPPQAQLPSSPTPSTPGFRPSTDGVSTRTSSIGNWDFSTSSS